MSSMVNPRWVNTILELQQEVKDDLKNNKIKAGKNPKIAQDSGVAGADVNLKT